MKKTHFPSPLQPGDAIAIVSPSGAVNPDYIDGAAMRLRNWGFEVVEAPHARNTYGRYSGTADERISDLQWAVDNPYIKAVLCSRGGYGAIQIIEHIDFSPLLQTPKWLIGFSDITVFHAALTNMSVPSIHGIMAKNLTENNVEDPSVVLWHDILKGDKPVYRIASHALNRTGLTTGRLTGGNLSVLYGLRGTIYDIKPQNSILFLEDLAEKPYHIDRMMQNLKIGGILEKLSGLVVGQFSETEEDPLMYKTVYEIIAGAVSGYNYPVCFNFPAGHIAQNMPLIMGAEIKLEVTEKEVSLRY